MHVKICKRTLLDKVLGRETKLSYWVTLSEVLAIREAFEEEFPSARLRMCPVSEALQPIYMKYVHFNGEDIQLDYCQECNELCDPHKEIEVSWFAYQCMLKQII